MNPAIIDKTKTEFFTWKDELKVIYQGSIYDFNHAPLGAIDLLRDDLENNPRALDGLQLLGITDPVEQLRKYASCRYGSLNDKADFGEKTPDEEMFICDKQNTCRAAGLICRRKFATKGETMTRREVEIGYAISTGQTVEQIAEALFVAPITIHSTLLHIKQKLNLLNYAGIASHFTRNFLNVI